MVDYVQLYVVMAHIQYVEDLFFIGTIFQSAPTENLGLTEILQDLFMRKFITYHIYEPITHIN
jgi:hypothetical protein